ncbi:hypothetical protein ACKUZF_019300 [Proteus mirabilis]
MTLPVQTSKQAVHYVRIVLTDIIWGLGLADAIASSTVQKGQFHHTQKSVRKEVC